MKRIKVLTSHAAHARFLADLEGDEAGNLKILGTIPKHAEIPSPYAFSSTHFVYEWNGAPVIVVETRHRRYEVFQVEEQINPADEEQGPAEKRACPDSEPAHDPGGCPNCRS